MANLNFDASQVDPASSYSVLPKDKYLCMAVASELKKTKSNNGQYLQITFEVIDGQFKGRKIFERLNIINQNKTAEEIAHRALSALCHSVGVIQLNDSEQLHNIPVVLDIGVEEPRDGYDASNRVKGYESANGEAPPEVAAPRTATPTPAAAPAAKSTPAWKKAKAA